MSSQTLNDAITAIVAALVALAQILLCAYIGYRYITNPNHIVHRPAAERRREEEEKAWHERLRALWARWLQEGHTIHWGPLWAYYYGGSTRGVERVAPDPGALGLVDDQFVFVGISSANFEIRVPLANLRWLGQSSVTVQQQNAVTLHCTLGSRWQLYNFGLDDWQDLVNGLKDAGISLATYQDLGPTDVLRLRQNVFGQWERDHTVQLYLAPDRLLTDWRTEVMLDHVKKLA